MASEWIQKLKEFNDAFSGYRIDKVDFTDGVEGGLTFFLSQERKKRKVVLGYTELGEWIESITEAIE